MGRSVDLGQQLGCIGGYVKPLCWGIIGVIRVDDAAPVFILVTAASFELFGFSATELTARVVAAIFIGKFSVSSSKW